MTSYSICMERTDGTCDAPFLSYPNKREALRAARRLAKMPSWDCTKLWVDNAEGVGIASFELPPYKDA